MKTDAEDLAAVVAAADHFVAAAFRGVGVWDRIQVKSLEEARAAAAVLYRNRPVAIYVVAYDHEGATERSRHVENWAPPRLPRSKQ